MQVDDLLNTLESRFDAMSNDILSRRESSHHVLKPPTELALTTLRGPSVSTLSSRVDALENSIGDLMSGNPFPEDTAPRPPAADLMIRAPSSAGGADAGGPK